MGNLAKRLISASVLGSVVILGIIYLPPQILKVFVAAITGLASWEALNLLSKKGVNLSPVLGGFLGFVFSLLVLNHLWLLAVFLIFLYSFYLAAKKWNLDILTLTTFGLVYTVFFVSSLGLLIDIDKNLLFVLFATVWTGDTAAYLVGKAIGKHKLSPKISPNKTWEGAIGSFLASVLAGGVVAYWLGFKTFLPAIFLVAILMQIGDLFESFIKRQVRVKDSSNLIPGHGGILDRIDGLIFASATFVVYNNLYHLLLK